MKPNISPIPIQPKETNFPTAIQHIMIGKKITKLEWNDKEIYGILHSGILKLHKTDGKLYDWIISDGDLTGNDWIVID